MTHARPPLAAIALLALLLAPLAACDDGDAGPPAPPDALSAADAAGECAGDATRPCPGGPGDQRCVDGRWGPCAAPAETCDGADEDGDGAVDEGLVEGCGSAVGACVPGIRVCTAGAWGPCVGASPPAAETCDGVDEDCDGEVDEGPILPESGRLPSPVVGGPDAIVWTGRTYAVAMPGYPNWVIRLAVADATVWRADLVGRVPVEIALASGPAGLAMAWTERTGALVFGTLGWDAEGLAPRAVEVRGPDEGGRASGARIAGETSSTLVGWIDDREGARRPFGIVLDPSTGEPRFEPVMLGGPDGATGLSLANNGEDGFAAAWRIAAEGEPGPVWFARLDNGAAPGEAPFEAIPEAARSASVLADYYVDTYAIGWTDGERVVVSRIARGAGEVGSSFTVAEGQAAADEVRLIRDDSTWAVFWTAEGDGGARVARGRIYDRGGNPMTPAHDLMPAGERVAVTFGRDGYALATVLDGALVLRAGPIRCRPE